MDTKTDILYRYPFPIAVTYLNADNARETVGAHDQRIRLFEVILKYLSSIAIAQYLHDRLEDPRVKQALRGLARPSLGQWNGFLREVLASYRRAGRSEGLLVADLPDAYNVKRRDRPAMAKAYNEIINYVQGRTDSATTSLSVRQFCDAMVSYRNKTVGHGVITRYHCEQMNEPLFHALEEMLTQLGFLKQHRLVYIEDVRVRRGSYAHEMMSFMGSTPPSRMREAYVTDNQDEYRYEEQLYLCARDENVPVLSLHPLVIAWQGDVLFLNESARERGIEYLSYQSGQIKKPDRLLEDFKEILGFVLSEEHPEASFERIRQQAVALPEEPPDPFEVGQQALAEESWGAALESLTEVSQDSEHYAEAQEGIAKAKQQQNWLNRYNQAQALIGEQEWDQAQETLETLIEEAGEYSDARGLLQTIRMERAQEESLLRLYEYAQDALQTAQWERAYDLLTRIHELRADFRDVSTLLARQKQQHDLYDQAIETMSDRRWVEAQSLLRQLEVLEPNYKNLASLLQRTEQEMETEAQLSSLYSKVKSHLALEEWEEALQALDQIADRQKDYRDVPELIAEVQAKILVPCPRCGAMTPSGYKFCGRCGAPRIKARSVTCPRCGNENPAGRKFCGKCGYALA
jgi:outer membrane protein assembly factor BamD (BamD/ComL family)